MNRMCPKGAKLTHNNWFMTVAFAITILCFLSVTGAAQTKETKPCSQQNSDTTVPTEVAQLPLGPSTQSFKGFFGYSGFEGFGQTSSLSLVGKTYDALVTQIYGPTVAVNDVDQINVEGPCVGTTGTSRKAIK
jgi:hypothetical protein